MSSTRYASSEAGSDAAPERFLASAKLRGINIGLNVICRIARVRTREEGRAMIWLHNYARTRNLTADALSGELDLDKREIRAALTDPEADLARFVRQVGILRAAFEKSLPPLAAISTTAIVHEGMALAAKRKVPVEIIGLTRMGKTVTGHDYFTRNFMDRGVWVKTPPGESERDFIAALADAFGISFGSAKKVTQIAPQIAGCVGENMVELICLDEAHYLWPSLPQTKPKRLDFVRHLYDLRTPAAIGVVVFATPQFTNSMNAAIAGNPRWAPGQWDGRVIRYHFPETMTDRDLQIVAQHHAPDFSAEMIFALVMQAKATEGFCGAMVNTITLAREKAETRGESAVTLETLKIAMKQMTAGTRIAQLAKALPRNAAGPLKPLRRAA